MGYNSVIKMKILNKYLGHFLATLTILVCCATLLIALISHRQHFSHNGELNHDFSGSETIKPVGPLLTAAFDTIRSGAGLATFYIPDVSDVRNGKEDDMADRNLIIPVAISAGESAPIRSPLHAFDQTGKIESVINDHMGHESWLLVDKNLRTPALKADIVEGMSEKGESLHTILLSLGTKNAEEYVMAAKKAHSSGTLRQQRPWRAFVSTETGRLARFECEIDDSRLLLVEGEEKPTARLEKLEYDMTLERLEGIIEDNLFNAVIAIGENPQLADDLARLFGSESNFIRKLQSGDIFTALVEKKYRNGEFRGYGRILAARLINRGRLHEAFLFRDDAGRAHYFNGKGENLRKTRLLPPLSGARATSRYSENRLHPILNIVRPHLGVDYGAPHGTPVKAVADGIVKECGVMGGYGNTVVIEHRDGLESLYAHLSRYASGLRVGQHVRQGQLIGNVGSTGLATGPHLDFRLRKNGEYINPEKIVKAGGAPVSAELKKEFEKTLEIERACLDGERKIENYSPTSIMAPALASFVERHVAESEKPHKESRQEKFRRKLLARKAALRNAYLRQKKLMQSFPRKALKRENSFSKPDSRSSERAASARKQKKRS